jgi:hypothetical protein
MTRPAERSWAESHAERLPTEGDTKRSDTTPVALSAWGSAELAGELPSKFSTVRGTVVEPAFENTAPKMRMRRIGKTSAKNRPRGLRT